MIIKTRKFNFTKLQFFVISLLILSVFFRLVNIDEKVYWIDEAATSIRISGYTWAEMDRELGKKGVYKEVQEIGVEDLQKYQRINTQKSLIDTIRGLASEEPQLPPLYFSMVRLWAQAFGDSVAVIRSFSALSSLLVFPSVYWLCLELFDSSLVGWIAIALMAVSPYQLLCAQEARPYMLWAVTILLSTAALMRAVRLKTKLSWGIYAATVILGLYTHMFFGLVAIGHGISVIAAEGWRLSKTVIAYLLASLLGIIVFLPWLFFTITGFSKVLSTTESHSQATWAFLGVSSQLTLLLKWARNISVNFIDTDKEQRVVYLGFDNLLAYLIQSFVVLIMVTLVGYSVYFVWRNAPKKASLFILPLIGLPALALLLPDLIFGASRSVTRYVTPCFLGMQLAVAYLLATQIGSVSNNIWRQKLWRLVLVVLVSAGVLSCIIIAPAPAWWTKPESDNDLKMAQIVNQAPRPLLIFAGMKATASALSLSYILDPKVRLELVKEPNMPRIFDGFSDVFLFRPTDEILDKFQKEQNYKIEPLYKYTKRWIGRVDSGILLWRVEK